MENKVCPNCLNSFTPKDKRNSFCSQSCSSLFHSGKAFERLSHSYICDKCAVAFTTKYKIRNGRKAHCPSCAALIRTRPQDPETLGSIYQISSRTRRKVLQRLEIGCSACGWSEALGDLHHIIPKQEGGEDSDENLTYVCPNCHRKAHSGLEVPFKTFKEQVGDSWKAYYAT